MGRKKTTGTSPKLEFRVSREVYARVIAAAKQLGGPWNKSTLPRFWVEEGLARREKILAENAVLAEARQLAREEVATQQESKKRMRE